nr:NYN domain-containing protein [Maliibacterium massiliense]
MEQTASRKNFAVLIDMENAGGKRSALETIIETLKIRGNILIGRVYGYSDRYAELKEVLLSNTFTAIPSLRYGTSQKNSLDIQLVVDALEVAYTNPLIDCFCIVSGDSDFTPLVGRLKSMGKYVLGISRSECASTVFINACNEFLFLESVRQKTPKAPVPQNAADSDDEDEAELMRVIETILREQADTDGWMLASVLKDVVLRLRPDFNEKAYGESTFGRLLLSLEKKFATIRCTTDHYNFKVRYVGEQGKQQGTLNRTNWIAGVQSVLDRLKADGFERVNPSIIKEGVCEAFPGFEERAIGYRKFSDMMKALEREKRIRITTDENMNMLVTIL